MPSYLCFGDRNSVYCAFQNGEVRIYKVDTMKHTKTVPIVSDPIEKMIIHDRFVILNTGMNIVCVDENRPNERIFSLEAPHCGPSTFFT